MDRQTRIPVVIQKKPVRLWEVPIWISANLVLAGLNSIAEIALKLKTKKKIKKEA
jgi:hypothetical protein